MIKLVNKITGTEMWVDENRADSYIAAGHKPAASVNIAKEAEKAEEPAKEVPEEKKAKKATKKK